MEFKVRCKFNFSLSHKHTDTRALSKRANVSVKTTKGCRRPFHLSVYNRQGRAFNEARSPPPPRRRGHRRVKRYTCIIGRRGREAGRRLTTGLMLGFVPGNTAVARIVLYIYIHPGKFCACAAEDRFDSFSLSLAGRGSLRERERETSTTP